MIAGPTELMLEVYGAAFVLELWSAPESAIPLTSVDLEPVTFRILQNGMVFQRKPSRRWSTHCSLRTH